MNRKIAFRVWDKAKKIWVTNGEIEFSISEGTMMVVPNTIEHIGDSTHDYYVDERFATMQYTGLRDWNGKKVFEGDIVLGTWTHAYAFEVTYGLQEFADGSFQDYCYGWNLPIEPHPRTGDKAAIHVIGNIYENPELLEKETP